LYYQGSKDFCVSGVIICGVTTCCPIVFDSIACGVISGGLIVFGPITYGGTDSAIIGGNVIVLGIVVSSDVTICGCILLSGTIVLIVNQLKIAGVRSVLPAISVALTWNVCTVLLPVPLIPNAIRKTSLSKTIGLEQVNVGKLSILQLYPVIPESSMPPNINVIKFDAVVPPPICKFNPVLLSMAEVMTESGGVVSK
jgi:hypothetical protein